MSFVVPGQGCRLLTADVPAWLQLRHDVVLGAGKTARYPAETVGAGTNGVSLSSSHTAAAGANGPGIASGIDAADTRDWREVQASEGAGLAQQMRAGHGAEFLEGRLQGRVCAHSG